MRGTGMEMSAKEAALPLLWRNDPSSLFSDTHSLPCPGSPIQPQDSSSYLPGECW